MKRIILFVLTNLAVMAVLLITTRILGVDRFLTANGLNMTALAGFSLIIGFGGAIISLLISKPMAKFSTKRAGDQPAADRRRSLDRADGAEIRRQGRYRHARGRPSTTAHPTPLPPAPSRTRPWSRCPPACCRA
jgi:Zn-dependent protease with chaperone function